MASARAAHRSDTLQWKQRSLTILLLLIATAGNPAVAAADPPSATGIPQCDDYYAAIAACLPQMCEAERALVETELSFHQEVLSKTIELKGRAAAAEACAQDLLAELQSDPYGCYEPQRAKPGLPKPPIQDVRVRPTPTSVTISFKISPQKTNNGRSEVAIVAEDLQNEIRYTLAPSDGVFTLNTAVDRPTGAPSESGSFRLAPQSSYCFAIKSADGEERRGSFTTSPEH
jgi:hypothetical protein